MAVGEEVKVAVAVAVGVSVDVYVGSSVLEGMLVAVSIGERGVSVSMGVGGGAQAARRARLSMRRVCFRMWILYSGRDKNDCSGKKTSLRSALGA